MADVKKKCVPCIDFPDNNADPMFVSGGQVP